MLNSGELFALDHSRKKVNALNLLLEAQGYTCARAIYADAAACVLPLDSPGDTSDAAVGAADAQAAPRALAPPEAVASPRNESGGRSAASTPPRPDVGTRQRVDRKARVAAARAKGKVDKHSAAKLAANAQPSGSLMSSAAHEPPKFTGFAPESFDAVLLDPPCSALGLRPRLRVDLGVSDLEEMVAAQRRILWAAVMLLKPGGCLVFSTCTVCSYFPRASPKQILRWGFAESTANIYRFFLFMRS